MKDHITPEIYCALSLYVYSPDSVRSLCEHLNRVGVPILEQKISNHNVSRIILARVDYSEIWHLDEALTLLFNQVATCFSQLKETVSLYGVNVQVDIAFWQYGTYPSLSIMGENMRKIREIEADVDIDAYSG